MEVITEYLSVYPELFVGKSIQIHCDLMCLQVISVKSKIVLAEWDGFLWIVM